MPTVRTKFIVEIREAAKTQLDNSTPSHIKKKNHSKGLGIVKDIKKI